MTLASLFRSAPAAPTAGRHAAPDTGEEDRIVEPPAVRPGRHAAPEDDAADHAEDQVTEDAADDASNEVTERSGDLLDALGFRYGD
jgi:hypothetical protein